MAGDKKKLRNGNLEETYSLLMTSINTKEYSNIILHYRLINNWNFQTLSHSHVDALWIEPSKVTQYTRNYLMRDHELVYYLPKKFSTSARRIFSILQSDICNIFRGRC